MKKIIAVFLLLLICNTTVVPCEARVHKGRTKGGVIYQYNTKNKTLTLSGKKISGTWNEQQGKGRYMGDEWNKWQDKVKKIVVKKGVKSIENGALENYFKLKTIDFPKTLKKIGERAFENIGIKKLILPDSVLEIGEYAFSSQSVSLPVDGCIERIKLPSKLQKIGESSFSFQHIKCITIPENVTSIGKYAFEGCIHLKRVIIKSKKLKKVGKDAFYDTDKNLVVYVPKDKIDDYRKMLWKGAAFNIEPIP